MCISWHVCRGGLSRGSCIGDQPLAMMLRRRIPAGAGPPSETDTMDVSQPEQVVLDGNAIAKDANSNFFHLAGHTVRRACASVLVTYRSRLESRLRFLLQIEPARCPGARYFAYFD